MRVRWGHIAIVLAVAGMALLAAVVVSPAIERRLAFGTFSTNGPPPRIDYCGRRYYPDSNFPNYASESGSTVAAELSANGQTGLTRVGTTPSGMPILANVIYRVRAQTRLETASYPLTACHYAPRTSRSPA